VKMLIAIKFTSMKKKPILLSGFLLMLFCSVRAQTVSFSFTGTVQYYTVPVGFTRVVVDVKGAAGGASFGSPGGCGGEVVCTLAVSSGQVLNLFVGSMGADASFYSGGAGGNTGPAVSGGTGATSLSFGGGGGGGGASDIRTGGLALANRIVAAGGGGGGGDDCFGSDVGGGGGGPATAGDGNDCGTYSSASCGAGATPGAGGAGSTGGGFSGVALVGGDGIATSVSISTFSSLYYDGGGGGGGFYGGGGGSAGGGGGGSSYTDPIVSSGVVSTQGVNCIDGSITITPLCSPPVAGPITGPSTLCLGSIVTYSTTSTFGGTWSSTFPLVASVNPLTGSVQALSVGTTTIRYSYTNPCGTISVTTTVNVIAGAPAPITGHNPICLDMSNRYSDTLADATGGGSWSSGTLTVGTIDPVLGIVTTMAPGTTLITYTLGACTTTMALTVNPRPSHIVGADTICQGLTSLMTTATPGGTWSSSILLVATVNSTSGLVTAGTLGTGATNIIYTLPTGCDTMHFLRSVQPPVAIVGPGRVCQGSYIRLSETVGNGRWAATPSSMASVSPDVWMGTAFYDTITGLLPGTVTISYTTPTCPPATRLITVDPLPTPIYGPSAVCVGMSTTLVDTTLGGTWSSLDPAITVSSTGVVTSSTPGISGVIKYTLPTTCYITTTVNVGVPPSAIIGPDSICIGTDSIMTDTTVGGVWSSTDLAIARINFSTGADTGISAGTVNISYTLPSGCFAVKPFLIQPPVTPMVTINYFPTGIICEGSADTFVATPTNGGTTSYLWKKFSGFGSFGVADTTNDTLIYNPAHGDAIMCFMHVSGVCALVDHVTDTIVVNVYPNNVVPAVTISTNASDTLQYLGEVITFYASVTWGGTMPTYQWYHNSLLIPGANAMSYSTPVYGLDTFWCVVTGNPPCESTTPGPGMSNKITIYDFLSVKPVDVNNNSFSLFPNPNTGVFTLTGILASGVDNEVALEVSDVLGQIVYSGKTTPHGGQVRQQISLDNAAPGSYLLRIKTDKGSETFHFVIGK
jgi:Glycine rich protein/Secretion system C-terminal sorting domain